MKTMSWGEAKWDVEDVDVTRQEELLAGLFAPIAVKRKNIAYDSSSKKSRKRKSTDKAESFSEKKVSPNNVGALPTQYTTASPALLGKKKQKLQQSLSTGMDAVSTPKKKRKKLHLEQQAAAHVETSPMQPDPSTLEAKVKGSNMKKNELHVQADGSSQKSSERKRKTDKRSHGILAGEASPVVSPHISSADQITHKPALKKGKMSLREKLRKQLDSGQFRFVNEQLYTSTSAEAVALFKKEPKLFDVYHDGFATQVSKWPVNPLDKIIAWLQTKPSSLVVADMGCGEAKLSQSVSQKVHSFDLVAANENVVACDMARVPLKKGSVDIVVFCLSLMGTNLDDFVREAHRILRSGGILKVAEVKSRIESAEDFCSGICDHGFELVDEDEGNKMFICVELTKAATARVGHCQLALKPCLYKRR